MTTEQPQIPKGKPIDFEILGEGYSEYRFGDGNFLRVRLVVKKVLKTDMKSPDGLPVYTFEFMPVSTVYSPQDMMDIRKSSLRTEP